MLFYLPKLALLRAAISAPSAAEPSRGRTPAASAESRHGASGLVRRIWFVLAFGTLSTAAGANTATWEKTVWQDEPAWTSTQGQIRAIVTEARTRLIYLGAKDGSLNLLNAPWPQVHPDKKNPWPNQGGHRFWLGPQSRWVWPPLPEWEYLASQDVSTETGALILHQAHLNSVYPAITREYAWEGNRLRCTARWHDNGQSYFGMHVVAVNTPFVITPRLEKNKEIPTGMVVAQMVDPEAPIQLPHPAIMVNGDTATVHSGIETIKLGFASQPLTIERQPGWKLSVQPGPSTAATSESPDHGYLSQIWVGDATHELAELEQLTPYLKGDAQGCCSSTIYLEATPPEP